MMLAEDTDLGRKQTCTWLSYYEPVEVVIQHALCMQPFMLSTLIVGTGLSWIDMQRGACHINCIPLGAKACCMAF